MVRTAPGASTPRTATLTRVCSNLLLAAWLDVAASWHVSRIEHHRAAIRRLAARGGRIDLPML